MSVRLATPNDIDAIVGLQRLIHAEHLAADPLRWRTATVPGAVYAAWLNELILEPARGTVLVADRDGACVGYLVAELEAELTRHWSPACVYLHDLFVLPPHRRAGIARGLMGGLILWRENHHPSLPIRLLTAAHNEPARRFFARYAFRPAAVEMIEERANEGGPA